MGLIFPKLRLSGSRDTMGKPLAFWMPGERRASAPRVVDLFAGAGGTSTGATLAGCRVVMALNHWQEAVSSHALNHPEAMHFCEDAGLFNLDKLPEHDLLVASPSCTGHTKARGAERPGHDAARATAWCVVRVAEARRPPRIIVENVPEMLDWVLFPAWLHALELLGYKVTWVVLDAANFGVPQRRKRAFITASLDGCITLTQPMMPHVAARTVLDLSARGHEWSRWANYAVKSQARIRAAQKRRGSDCLVPYYSSLSSHAGVSLDGPIGTLTTKDRYVLVRGPYARVLTVAEQLALSGFPAGYRLTGPRYKQVAMIGNAVPPPVARWVIEQVMGVAQ